MAIIGNIPYFQTNQYQTLSNLSRAASLLRHAELVIRPISISGLAGSFSNCFTDSQAQIPSGLLFWECPR